MGVTGLTNNKLFKIRTININEPYQVGKNGVTNISGFNGNKSKITYVLDGIKYSTIINTSELSQSDSSKNTITFSKVGEIVNNKVLVNNQTIGTRSKKIKGTNKVNVFEPKTLSSVTDLKRYTKAKKTLSLDENENNLISTYRDTNLIPDTIYETNKFSYDNFINQKIYKNDRYVGLISQPNVTSDVFMERDVNSSFEKHQRLSEINNLSELVSYNNGYFNVVNTF